MTATGPYTARLLIGTDTTTPDRDGDATTVVVVAGYLPAAAPRHGVIRLFTPVLETITAVPVMVLTATGHTTGPGSRAAGAGWRLVPAEHTDDGLTAAPGMWATRGDRAVLPLSVTRRVPGAPVVVAVHDLNPHTGRPYRPR